MSDGAAMLPVAILAGGLATRLRPLTENVPKALVDVAGEPFVAHQLRLLARQGIRRVVMCVGYRGEMVQEAVGDGAAFGVSVQYSFDGPRLLGTAGALKGAAPLLGEAFFVLYGDSYLTCDFRAVQRAFMSSGKQALMTVFRNEGRYDQSNVEMRAGEIVAYDKSVRSARMRHIDYGLGVLASACLSAVPDGTPFDLARLYQTLLASGQLGAHEVRDRFFEIGSLEGLEELRQILGSASAAAR